MDLNEQRCGGTHLAMESVDRTPSFEDGFFLLREVYRHVGQIDIGKKEIQIKGMNALQKTD